jgi:hypothetical protein
MGRQQANPKITPRANRSSGKFLPQLVFRQGTGIRTRIKIKIPRGPASFPGDRWDIGMGQSSSHTGRFNLSTRKNKKIGKNPKWLSQLMAALT